ncbi:hypothetical protein [Clostridium sp.]|uniref:hypothetical protein n=1 Tax=Clostridium sp. TaxID=1506 RepID=UPI003F3CEE66
MKLENLKKCFEAAIENGTKYVGVKVWMYGFEECEVIINPTNNFGKKLEYYQIAYNDDLNLKNAPDKIKIVGITYGNSLEEIEQDLI